jgi:hypothetical protein
VTRSSGARLASVSAGSRLSYFRASPRLVVMRTGQLYFLLRVAVVQSSTVIPRNRLKSFTLPVTKMRS